MGSMNEVLMYYIHDYHMTYQSQLRRFTFINKSSPVAL